MLWDSQPAGRVPSVPRVILECSTEVLGKLSVFSLEGLTLPGHEACPFICVSPKHCNTQQASTGQSPGWGERA